MKNQLLLFFVITFCGFHSNINSQKKIEKSKEALTESSGVRNNSSSSSSSRSSSSSSSSSDNLFAEIIIEGFIYITYGTFKYGLIGDYNNEEHLNNKLSPYPFKEGSYGNFNSNDSLYRNRMRLDLENSFIYNSNNLFGNHLKAKIRPFQYFYLQTDFHQLYEFDKINDKSYKLSIFQFNFCYDRIRFNRFNLGWSLGATYIGNEVKKAGFAYGLNADYFLSRNISFTGTAKWSSINTHPVNSFELQNKLHKKNYCFSLGFEHLKIAEPTYNFVTLGAGIYF
jgi:hypothetical protein